jgi:smad nuclear-interacting protein 1
MRLTRIAKESILDLVEWRELLAGSRAVFFPIRARFSPGEYTSSLYLCVIFLDMDDESGPHKRRSYRSRSNSRSKEGDRYKASRRGRDQDQHRKRERSRSHEGPRTRRSLSPRDGHDSRRIRDSGHHQRRYDSDRGEREARRRRSHSDSRSPSGQQRSAEPFKRSKIPLPAQKDAFQNEDKTLVKGEPLPEKQKPNFGTTGRLAAAANTVQTGGQAIVLKYHEPAEARKPSTKDRWRMYVFKDNDIVDTIGLAEQSCWLFGREAAVVDVLVEHPSCSKQHAVIQFRYIEKRNEFGDKMGKVRPYVLDLESANKTQVNGSTIPEAKYVELRDKDVVQFGHSSREYVMQLPPVGG